MPLPPMSHAKAAEILRQEWPKVHGREPTDAEVLFTQAVGWLETHYARAGKHGERAAQGMFNWANIEKARTGDTCPDGWAPGTDSGKPVCFRVYPSDNDAARALIHTLTKRHWPVLQAIADEGTPEAVAKAMKASPAYYSAPESNYATALRNAIKAITGNAPVPAPTQPAPPVVVVPGGQRAPSGSVIPVIVAASILGGAVFLMRKGRFPMARKPLLG